MAERFHNITKDEMDKYLRKNGFRPMTVEGTVELVYGKIVQVGNHRLSLRVNTAINPSGESREKGSDAIRVQLYYQYQDNVVPVGKPHKCLRVKNWKSNIFKAIRAATDEKHFQECPLCKHPMVERENKSTGGKFWGCVTYFETKCSGKVAKVHPPAAPEQQTKLFEALRTIYNRWGVTKNTNEEAPWHWDDFHGKVAGHLRVCMEKIAEEKLQ